MSDPACHHRRSIRLQGWDYTAAGVYFVTLVVQDRALAAIRAYIQRNPRQWALDRDNPAGPARHPVLAAADDYLREAGTDL